MDSDDFPKLLYFSEFENNQLKEKHNIKRALFRIQFENDWELLVVDGSVIDFVGTINVNATSTNVVSSGAKKVIKSGSVTVDEMFNDKIAGLKELRMKLRDELPKKEIKNPSYLHYSVHFYADIIKKSNDKYESIIDTSDFFITKTNNKIILHIAPPNYANFIDGANSLLNISYKNIIDFAIGKYNEDICYGINNEVGKISNKELKNKLDIGDLDDISIGCCLLSSNEFSYGNVYLRIKNGFSFLYSCMLNRSKTSSVKIKFFLIWSDLGVEYSNFENDMNAIKEGLFESKDN